MTLLRLVNGSDVVVKMAINEVIALLLTGKSKGDSADIDFVELPGESGTIHVRPSSVVAIMEHAERKTSGFAAI